MKTYIKILHWLPRIICILSILFISLFAADSFAPELSFWQQIEGFFIHLIPSFILLAILILFWEKELISGILFTAIGIILTPTIFSMNYKINHSILISLEIIAVITFPFFLVGILFLLSYFFKKKHLKTTQNE